VDGFSANLHLAGQRVLRNDTQANMRTMIPTVMRMEIEPSDMMFSCAAREAKPIKLPVLLNA
jgi:hypothetical protein